MNQLLNKKRHLRCYVTSLGFSAHRSSVRQASLNRRDFQGIYLDTEVRPLRGGVSKDGYMQRWTVHRCLKRREVSPKGYSQKHEMLSTKLTRRTFRMSMKLLHIRQARNRKCTPQRSSHLALSLSLSPAFLSPMESNSHRKTSFLSVPERVTVKALESSNRSSQPTCRKLPDSIITAFTYVKIDRPPERLSCSKLHSMEDRSQNERTERTTNALTILRE